MEKAFNSIVNVLKITPSEKSKIVFIETSLDMKDGYESIYTIELYKASDEMIDDNPTRLDWALNNSRIKITMVFYPYNQKYYDNKRITPVLPGYY